MTGEESRTKLKIGVLAGLTIVLVIARNISIKSVKKMTHKDPTIGQYLNRLVEFFDSEKIDQAQDEFLNMIDFGVMPQDAFGILTFSGELN
jgi:hypothetical protein